MSSLDERLAELPANRQALLAKLLSRRRAAARPEIPRGEGRRPLSFAQRQFYVLWRQEPDGGLYNVPMAVRLRGEFDAGAAEAALRDVVRRHEILRTRYVTEDDEPVTALGAPEEFELTRTDVSGEAVARELAAGFAARPFDLETGLPLRATLIRLADDDHVLVVVVHHIATDGASTSILFQEFAAAYTALRAGSPPALPEPPIQYADYAGWQRSTTEGERLERGLEFWDAWLEGVETSLDLPTDRPRPSRPTHAGGRRKRRIPRALAARMHEFAAAQGVTPFMTALTALGVVLRRQSGKQDFLVGTPASNRPTPHTERLIGCFANTLVLRVRPPGSATVREGLRQVRDDVAASYDHQDVPFEKVVALRRPERTLTRNPLFQVMFVYQQVPETAGLPGLAVERFDLHNGTAKFDLDLSLLDGPEGIDVSCEYDAEIFTPERIDALLGHLENAIAAMVAGPEAALSSLPVLGEAERRRAALEWNATEVPYPADQTIAGLFAERVAAAPGAPAVRTTAGTLTYDELDRRSNRLARLLAERGAGPGTVVGVATDRTADLPLAVLAVLKSGAAYLPLDTAHPADRLALMVADSGALAVLTNRSVAGRVPAAHAPVLVLEDLAERLDALPDEPVESAATPEDLCYVIFTSGSTGRPKAVLLDQRGRINNFADFNRRYEIGRGDAVLSVSSLAFDMTAYDVIGTLLAGGTMVLPEPARERDPGHWLDLIREHEVSVWHSVPALLGLLIDAADDLGVARLPSLRVVLLGGDWIPTTMPDALRALSPDARVVSLGGATEASMDSTIFEVGAVDPAWRSIPYGRPMANQLAYVVDPEGHLVPPGVPGELFLGGAGLAWGYLGAAAQTADRFLPNPFSGVPGDRMYRTGDLARYGPDGLLELLGRIDFQVKIAGNRIELGEVEAALRAQPEIAQAVVAAPETGGRRTLVGYVVPEDGGTEPDPGALRERLRAALPEYMVPSALVVMERIPLTPNGKVDRGRLPVPGAEPEPGGDAQGREPKTPTELTLAEVWRNLLGREGITADDGFFALGGDSVACIRMVTRARAAGLELTPRLVFQHQTIGELAAAIDNAANEPAETTTGADRHVLAPIQRHMLSVGRLQPVPGLYVIQSAFPLPGELDERAFQEAWEWLFARHAILRTSYEDVASGRPRPVVAGRVEPPIRTRDLRGLTLDEQDRAVLAELDEERRAGFDLAVAPLIKFLRYRLTDDVQLVVQLHHYSVLDGWSCMQLRKDLLAAYLAFITGERPELPEPPPFDEHVRWIAARDTAGAARFWAGHLGDSPGPWAGPPEDGHLAGRPVRLVTDLDPALLKGLDAYGREHGVTFATLVQLAWAEVVAGLSGRDDVVFGVTTSGRPALAGAESAVGPFINTMPVRFAFRAGEPVVAAAARLQVERAVAEEHAVLELGAMTQGRALESVLVFDNYPVDESLRAAALPDAVDHPLIRRDLGLAQTEFPVRVDVLRGAQDALAFTFAADRALPEQARELGARLVAALERMGNA
ncbi:amino acid adenylation domain-containing protein [Nonomuraea solani]|uniref:Amino acid adenylation domain-containing protein n=1 Tax=Nonomuraea solani TaxID=1144553 RepID=A0A1H5XS60_9ACTN|nr:non-ribosomal peptide synthetase [Nonomuraea solani]SEG14518.1 amino acid adenylation domain-containing protein [Nonomuraea solani]